MPNTVIVNKYQGRCACCGKVVRPREGYAVNNGAYRAWKIYHEACYLKGTKDMEIIYTYFPNTGNEVFQNAKGRCIDAPCCGCCSY